MKNIAQIRVLALILIILGAFLGWSVYKSDSGVGILKSFPFRLGLDLNGGTHLVYKADTSKIENADVSAAMQTLRDVIEKRVNLFGVSEANVRIEEGLLSEKGGEHKLIVELPGVTDVDQAKKLIGLTPTLEFKLADLAVLTQLQKIEASSTPEQLNAASTTIMALQQKLFVSTGLTGALLNKAQVQYNQTTGFPEVGITFNGEGASLFAKITKEHIGEPLAIFLDGSLISNPTIQTEIRDGKAQITGSFSVDEAKTLVRNLNYGALPVPIENISTQTVGASLGAEATKAGIDAGFFALIIIAIFLVVWYRLPGVLAVVALLAYVVVNLLIFKIFHITLTAAGIAGFILSLGMAVDANILIFERMKEELKSGKESGEAIKEGFHRAWPSIRDSNTSSIITAIILYIFPSASLIEGFALVFGIGVVTSMITAISLSRTLLLALGIKSTSKFTKFILSSGFTK